MKLRVPLLLLAAGALTGCGRHLTYEPPHPPIEGLMFSAHTVVVGSGDSLVQVTVRVHNRARSTRSLEWGACSINVRISTVGPTLSRSWDYAAWLTSHTPQQACLLYLARAELAPGDSISPGEYTLHIPVRRVLGDSLSAGRYRISARVAANGSSSGDLDGGEVDLRKPLLAVGQTTDRAVSPSPSSPAVTVGHFAMYSDRWVNLHHFLYQWARDELGLGTGRQHVPVPERAELAELSTAEREAWLRAITFYRDSVANLNHFDSRVLAQVRALSVLDDSTTSQLPNEIPGIANALEAALLVYDRHWWPAHNQANLRWINSVAPLLSRHESRYVTLISRIHGARWPATPFRVDVSAYANPAAGYTEPDSGRIVIFSTDAGNQGFYGLETLLHEVQHASVIGSRSRDEFRQAFRQAGVAEPQNLWHGIIFATAGEFVRSVAQEEGRPAHTPYWVKEGLVQFRGWASVQPATEMTTGKPEVMGPS